MFHVALQALLKLLLSYGKALITKEFLDWLFEWLGDMYVKSTETKLDDQAWERIKKAKDRLDRAPEEG